MVDMVVHRHEMKATVVRLCRLLTERGPERARGEPGARAASRIPQRA